LPAGTPGHRTGHASDAPPEDIDLLPTGLFSRLLKNTRHNATAFTAQLRQLFCTMATGGFFGVDAIAHFNGRLFEDDTVLELDDDGLDILARESELRWDSIEPSVFGTLFERSLDPAKRSQLGAHYTSKEDILLIVEPVLMAPLRRRWTEIRAQARALADRRDAASGGLRTRLGNEIGLGSWKVQPPRDLADDEILARLLALNYERAAAQEETRRPSASPIRKQAA